MIEDDLSALNKSTFSSSKSISNVATYVVTSDKRLFKLVRRDQRAEYIDLEWINELRREDSEIEMYENNIITNFDSFGDLPKTSLTHKYIFFQGKCYFFNGVSIVYLDFWKQIRQVLIPQVTNPNLVILHLNIKTETIFVYDNSTDFYTIKCA